MRVPVLKTDIDSFWHRRDPRVKVALFAFFIVLIYVAPSWSWMAGLVAIGIFLALTARAPVKWLLVMLLIQLPNILGLVVIPAWRGLAQGDFSFDAEFQFGLRMALGWVAAVLIGISLISTMEIDELVEGFRGIGVPRSVAFMIGYAFVLAYLSVNDIMRITEAARLKGMEFTLRRPARFVSNVMKLMVSILFCTVRRGAAMSAALEMRRMSFDRPLPKRARLKFDYADAMTLLVGIVLVGYAGAIRAEVMNPLHPMLGAPASEEKDSASKGGTE